MLHDIRSMSWKSKAESMKCTIRILEILSLTFGLLASGALSLAVATDYWLYCSEPHAVTMEGMSILFIVHSHSGLWRTCIWSGEYYSNETVQIACEVIHFDQDWGRVDNGSTTTDIMRSMRKAAPVIVGGLMIMLVAMGFSVVGNRKRDRKTLIGAVLYIFSALGLATGVIFYISAVNDEVSHRKKPENTDDPVFKYHYGWAFFFAGSSFISSLIASVADITLYLKRYPSLEDMVLIIPGLEKKSNLDFSSRFSTDDDLEAAPSMAGAQNPTIIL